MSQAKRIIPPSQQGFYDNYHFAPAVVDGQHLRCSGVIGIDLAAGKVSPDPATQFAQAFDNLAEVLAAAQFMKAAGIQLTRVPYKGGTQALPDLLAIGSFYKDWLHGGFELVHVA